MSKLPEKIYLEIKNFNEKKKGFKFKDSAKYVKISIESIHDLLTTGIKPEDITLYFYLINVGYRQNNQIISVNKTFLTSLFPHFNDGIKRLILNDYIGLSTYSISINNNNNNKDKGNGKSEELPNPIFFESKKGRRLKC
jgi:hypothetical protein